MTMKPLDPIPANRRAKESVSSPVPIFVPKPKYTPEAMRARIQGRALVGCIVQPNGVCTNIEILHSLDPTFGLDIEAINNVKQWKFKPGMRLGQAVPVKVSIDPSGAQSVRIGE